MDKALHVPDSWRAIATYVTDRRDLQYREPAFTDALLMTYQDSGQLAAIATAAIDMTTSLVRRCHDAGAIRRDFTAEDLYYADVANGLALRKLPRPPAETTTDAPASSSTASDHADQEVTTFRSRSRSEI
jgi:hypothetical protein